MVFLIFYAVFVMGLGWGTMGFALVCMVNSTDTRAIQNISSGVNGSRQCMDKYEAMIGKISARRAISFKFCYRGGIRKSHFWYIFMECN